MLKPFEDLDKVSPGEEKVSQKKYNAMVCFTQRCYRPLLVPFTLLTHSIILSSAFVVYIRETLLFLETWARRLYDSAKPMRATVPAA